MIQKSVENGHKRQLMGYLTVNIHIGLWRWMKMLCRDCYIQMTEVMSFSKDKHEKFCRCPKCYEETKHKKLRDDELVFGEVLNKEIHKTN